MISKKLKSWRQRLKLSQSQAAAKIGVPVRTLQEWEQDRQSPRGLARTALLAAIR